MAGENDNSNDELELAEPPVDLNEPLDSPSGPVDQVHEGLAEAFVEGVEGTTQLVVDTDKMIYDSVTTKEGFEAAWKTAYSMMKDIAAVSGAPVPQQWKDDVNKRLADWTKDSAKQLKQEWEEADANDQEVKFISKKIGWAVIAIIAKKPMARVCSKCVKPRKTKTEAPDAKQPPDKTPENGPQLPDDMDSGLAIEKARQQLPIHLLQKYDITPGNPNQPILFGQKGVSPTFSKKGKFEGADIDEIVQKLEDGTLTPNDIPIQYHWVNGQKVVVNNRSLAALSKAGKKPTNAIDMTGKLPPDGPDSLPSVLNRLEEMDGKPSKSMPVRTDPDDWNSPARETVLLSE